MNYVHLYNFKSNIECLSYIENKYGFNNIIELGDSWILKFNKLDDSNLLMFFISKSCDRLCFYKKSTENFKEGKKIIEYYLNQDMEYLYYCIKLSTFNNIDNEDIYNYFYKSYDVLTDNEQKKYLLNIKKNWH